MKRSVLVIMSLFVLVGAACTNIYTPTPSLPTATLPLLATFTPRYTATPVPTASPRPTFTLTPSVTPVPPTASNTPTATPTPSVLGRVSTVQEAVNMREGPSVTFPAIVGVLNNTDVLILAANEEQTWYNVRLEDGTEGWIAANLLFILPTTTPIPTNTVPGVVVEISGTPLATALLGGLPVTATPSFTPAGGAATAGTVVRRTPGTVTATVTPTSTLEPAALIPTVTPDVTATITATPDSAAPPTAAEATTAPSATPNDGQTTTYPVRQGFDVLAYCDDFNEVPPPLGRGSTVDVFWGWIASSQDYIQDHVASANYEVMLDGDLLENWQLYAAPVNQRADGNWQIYWYVPVSEPLNAGLHTITYQVTWDSAIFDGYEQFGPGTANEEVTGGCTFEVR